MHSVPARHHADSIQHTDLNINYLKYEDKRQI